MNKLEREELYLAAIDKWGLTSQLEMAQEEALELALALRKEIRINSKETYIDLIGEIADVEIMIEQLDFMFDSNFRKKVEEQKTFKLNRLKERLKK